MLLPSPRTGKWDPRRTNKLPTELAPSGSFPPPRSAQDQSHSLLTASFTFIFAAFLARSRPTSLRQSSRRALRAAKQVLQFRSASFSRLASSSNSNSRSAPACCKRAATAAAWPASRVLRKREGGRGALPYISSCVGSLSLGCDMKRPELVALFGGG